MAGALGRCWILPSAQSSDIGGARTSPVWIIRGLPRAPKAVKGKATDSGSVRDGELTSAVPRVLKESSARLAGLATTRSAVLIPSRIGRGAAVNDLSYRLFCLEQLGEHWSPRTGLNRRPTPYQGVDSDVVDPRDRANAPFELADRPETAQILPTAARCGQRLLHCVRVRTNEDGPGLNFQGPAVNASPKVRLISHDLAGASWW